ncbi:hypothetical protein [Hominilimicola sp.]|jgi:hypothetical protein|uniref:hypothetical protein n=1 Tax=Hominilimicola sp. TaxID=3073571 RepID=UPI002047BC92|nr:MAG TPA: hypothetical protein [Caudoviricetes sp.]
MEKIKMNGKTFELDFTGIVFSENRLVINMINVTEGLEEIEKIFSDTVYTDRIELASESDILIKIFKGFTKLTEVSKEVEAHVSTKIVDDEEVVIKSDIIKIVLDKVSDVEKRVSDLEETVDILVLENLGVKEEK